jgi:hypothetical protein
MEVWAGVSVSPTRPPVALVSSYSPPLLLDGDFTSQGTQTLTFAGSSAVGFEAGANVWLTPRAGIQLLVDRTTRAVSGVNSPYNVSLHYISRLPPNDEPVPVDIEQSSAWPDTAGSLTQLTLAVNGVLRVAQYGRASVRLSGGLSFYRLDGTVQPLGYTTYRLGGHSVLFEDDYRLAVSLDPSNIVGFNGGGDLDVGLFRGAAVVVGYRYFGGPTADLPVQVATILNPDQIIAPQTIADIAQRLAPPPARVSVACSRVIVGLKLSFPAP